MTGIGTRRAKVWILLAAVALICVLVSCSQGSTPRAFFAWRDAYVAMPEGSKWTMAATLYFEKGRGWHNGRQVRDIGL